MNVSFTGPVSLNTLAFNAAWTDQPFALPLPGTLPLFASGLVGLGALYWRRKWKQVAAANSAARCLTTQEARPPCGGRKLLEP